MLQDALRGSDGRQSSWQGQAQFPGVSSSCMACAYLLRDSDCSLLPAMAASSFAGEENNRVSSSHGAHQGLGEFWQPWGSEPCQLGNGKIPPFPPISQR